jgi:hypothetical protein
MTNTTKKHNYFLHTNYHHYTTESIFCGNNTIIDFISIGIINDNNEYYAISKDFNLKKAWNSYIITNSEFPDVSMNRVYRIRYTILNSLFNELNAYYNKSSNYYNESQNKRKLTFNYKDLKWLIKKYGKTNYQIKKEIIDFISINNSDYLSPTIKPKFYSYGNYDWVVLNQLLNNIKYKLYNFPKSCIILNQILDEKQKNLIDINNFEVDDNIDIKLNNILKLHPVYPKLDSKYSSLEYAKWNSNLYDFLEKL